MTVDEIARRLHARVVKRDARIVRHPCQQCGRDDAVVMVGVAEVGWYCRRCWVDGTWSMPLGPAR